jgi:hypothetical protein
VNEVDRLVTFLSKTLPCPPKTPYAKASGQTRQKNQVESKWYLQAAKRIINKTLTLFGKGDSLKGWFVKN